MLNHTVTKIGYSKTKGCQVRGIYTKSGEKFELLADYVVSTVSAGVLNSGNIIFKPALPDDKMIAIRKTKMAIFCKIFMRFEECFWDKDVECILIATEKRGQYNFWQSMGVDEKMIMVVVVGKEAKRVEKLAEEDLKNEL